MKKIESLNTSKLRIAELFGFMQRIDAYTEKLPGEGEKTVVATFKAAVAALDKELKDTQGNAMTATVTEADGLVDTAWRAIYAIAKVQLDNPAENVRKAAAEVVEAWRKYGDVTNLSYDEEYGNVYNALQDFTAMGVAKLTYVHVDDWVTELQTRYNEFISARSMRDAEQSVKVLGKVKQRRTDCEEAYRSLVATVNALVIMGGEDSYSTFIDNVNVAVEESKEKIAARAKRAEKKASSDASK